MIVGVDIGGTKTLLAMFTESGKLLEEVRFETNHNYQTFLKDLTKHAEKMGTAKAKIACAAVPGLLNRKDGSVIALGNIPWRNRPIRSDLKTALGVRKMVIENDSKLAGFAEAHAVKHAYSRIYYITFSTGIGGGLVINGKLAEQIIDSEVGKVPFPRDGKLVCWEDFASGRAFFNRYKQKAVDVTDKKIWAEFAQEMGLGISMICSVYQVEAIVFGGGLGQFVDRFREYLKPYVTEYLHPDVMRPKALLAPAFAEESVIYGCHAYAKSHLA